MKDPKPEDDLEFEDLDADLAEVEPLEFDEDELLEEFGL